MTIKVLYFASLRELFGREEQALDCADIETVADVWKEVSAGYEVSQSVLNSVNQEYAELDTPVKAGDEVAFFPPVTGG
ncbi:MAG: molybdopterin synthase sulfur carrier subunit [Cycloclasticus sp. symbiont of Poecilosclerida sp. M]|nr:MAG: molybdopterin synthase sulfur carrier subunit [Cycloclasticus sp. symbiont of Poecilosclerida sp. M]